jgi:protein-tyrosine kinase
MSRIYEALQKAELERKAERPDRPVVVPEVASENPLEQASVAIQEMPVAPPVMPVASPVMPVASPIAPEIPEVEQRAAVETGFDLNKVPRRVWMPNYDRLPALQERGAGVEQFRSLRSRLHELRDISPLKSILVTSGLPQEGKSFVAANLAISLARHRSSKVLLIDGDMRRYTLHQLLGCEAHPGLADYLAGKVGLVEVMQRAEESPGVEKTRSSVLPNLTFIAGGHGGDKAADLSGNPRFRELLETVSPYFDWIVVDSSPVLPVSDAVNLSRSCDGVLLVARMGVTKYPVAQRAQSEMKSAKVLGFVLNGAVKYSNPGTYYGYDSYDSQTE